MEQCWVESYSRTEQRLRQSILNQADLGNQLCPHPCMQDHLSPLILILFTGSPLQDHFSPFILILLFTGSPSHDHLHRIIFAGSPLSSHPHPRCRITSSPIKALPYHLESHQHCSCQQNQNQKHLGEAQIKCFWGMK